MAEGAAASAKTVAEPLGVALIIGAWNYPLLLTLSPLVACIGAGNAAVIKPSEMSPATASLLAELLPKYLDPKAFHVENGAVPETTALLAEKFDKIFFTGSAKVGKIVMTAAANNLTPVTLELGGQSPVIVDKSADLKLAALRIAFAKFANAGQTCVAPNHLFVHKDVAEQFTEILKTTIQNFYGDDPQKSQDYGRIVDERNFSRLTSLMKGTNIAYGGNSDKNNLYIAPTLLTNTDLTAPVMQEEIFGPILPIIKVGDVSEAFNHVASHDRPLAAYVFAQDKDVIKKAEEITAGAVCINNALIHLGVHDLPFGGVGESGFGQYHGKAGFDAFSHQKPILKSGGIEPGLHYPPHKNGLRKAILKRFGLL
ncbi:MAG: aldehyde dehydrogenase family protein [Proteobacteria bacterium]|nr:aldehyde dehydrogenase family protein [Pseudomonadota bacterium]